MRAGGCPAVVAQWQSITSKFIYYSKAIIVVCCFAIDSSNPLGVLVPEA